jgi:hypothetical protein
VQIKRPTVTTGLYIHFFSSHTIKVPEYDWYGFYGHKRSPSTYESIMRDEYAKWSYSPRISKAIQREVENCRKHAAIFDLSSFGKVR